MIRGTRNEPCERERYVHWNDVSPVLRILNRDPRRGHWVVVNCCTCRAWHTQQKGAK